jgi:threonine synthase
VVRVASEPGSFRGYRCSRCGNEYPPEPLTYTCPEDGANLDVLLDYSAVARRASPQDIAASPEGSIWRYLPLLPVGDPGLAGSALRAVGWTPLLKPPGLGESLGLARLYLKDDGRNPTASFKDRASAVVVARAREIGAEVVITASTGNAGAALAGMAAAAKLPAVILAPRSAPQAKIAQLLIFGARVFLVEGTYDQAFDLSLQAAKVFGWYSRNTGYNPFTAEGKKTAAFEICEQLTGVETAAGAAATSAPTSAAAWSAPEAVFVSVGDGNIISGLHKGFQDLRALGWIERLPRLYGVQSAGSAAVANAFLAGAQEIQPVRAQTLADSISVDLPRDGERALRAVRETGGAYLIVEDAEILQAMATLGRQAAVFAEPAGAAGFAGLSAALRQGMLGPEERIVVLVTGSGLKDVTRALQAVPSAPVIEPSLQALQRAVEAGV